MGGLAIFGDGNKWTPYDVRVITGFDSLSFTECWGSSPNNMYFAGLNGSLASYNGTSWARIPSGTTSNINDIWGVADEKTGKDSILAVISRYPSPGEDRDLLRINPDGSVDNFQSPLNREISSVWNMERSSPHGILYRTCERQRLR